MYIHGCSWRTGSAGEKPLTVQRRKKRTAFLKRAQPVEASRIESLENVLIFSMLRGVAMSFDKSLYLVESGDDALFARRASVFLLQLGEVVKL